jgi:hypothetical protein
MSELEQNYQQEKEGLASLYPDLVSGIENKVKKATLESGKSQKNTGKVLDLKVAKNDEKRLSQIKQKEQKELAKTTKSPYRGGGMPKGKKTAKTIIKEMAKQEMESYIQKKTAPLLKTLFASALGSYEFFLVENYENGQNKKILVKDPDIIENILNDPDMSQGDNYFIARTVQPDTHAAIHLLDRAYGKPSQSIDQTVKTVKVSDVIDQLVSDE